MIVLDTNIVSAALTKPDPALAEFAVHQWRLTLANQSTWITSITRAELLEGVSRLPDGQRKAALMESVRTFFAALTTTTLDFTAAAADHYAEIVSLRRQSGHPISVLDAQIAAIARAHRATLATRNIKDFTGLGLRLVNPFDTTTWGLS